MQHNTIRLLPPDDSERSSLHDEIHARPAARLRLPGLIVYVAVLNQGISREQECAHLRLLPGQQDLALAQLAGNFLRLRFEGYTVKWERHTEFTRYSIVQPLPASWTLDAAGLAQTADSTAGAAQDMKDLPRLEQHLVVSANWLRSLPGNTIAAIQMAMVSADLEQQSTVLAQAQRWFGGRTALASQLGGQMRELGRTRQAGQGAEHESGVSHASSRLAGHSWAMTELRVGNDGFERMLVLAPAGANDSRMGRASHRLLEMETYRLMALRGLPVAKALGAMLSQSETALADIMAQLESKASSEQELLDTLVSLAARVERATAEYGFRFSATKAYATLVNQRITELRELPLPGHQTIGGYLQHRLSPAMATVAATEQRLGALSERIARASALLRTRVDIATEAQNQQLLEKLTKGQALQLRLQSTVEGLSIAAISYYVVSLLLYGGKALKGLGWPINPEIAAGALVPVVLWAVWWGTRRIKNRMHDKL